MATFTITTTQNIDELISKTWWDIYNINGWNLTIDQHSRFWLNNNNSSATAATSMGNITISATLGWNVYIDWRYVRLIQYTGWSGTLPALNSTVTQWWASGKLMCVYSSLTAAPVVSGTIPATWWIMIKQWNWVEYSSGALTLSGITATSSWASVVWFLEIFWDDASTVTANRLWTFNVTWAWYRLWTTSWTSNQTLQIPNNWTLKHIAWVYIEKTAWQKDYEFYPNAWTTTTTGTEEARWKVVWIDNTWLVRIWNSGAATNGYTPVAWLEVVVPNVFLQCCLTTARNAEVIPNATVATRYDFTTTGGWVINMDKCNSAWYWSFAQPYSVQLSNSWFVDAITISECATACIWTKVWVGNKPTTALLTSALTMSTMPAWGTFTDCVWARVSMASAWASTNTFTDIQGFTFIRDTVRANTIQANAAAYSTNTTRAVNCTYTDCTIIQWHIALTTCTNITIKNYKYIWCVSWTTVATYATYVCQIWTNTTGLKIDWLTFPVTNCHPYAAILSISTAWCSNIKLRNIWTRSSPLNLWTVNACWLIYILVAWAVASDVYIQRVYCSNTRTWVMTWDNSSTRIIEENVYWDYADASDVWSFLNYYCKWRGTSFAYTAQTSVYWTHWIDHFTSATAGRIACLMNEPTSLTTSQVTLVNWSNFTSAWWLYMPTIGMSATFEMPYYALWHTAFTNTALIMAGWTGTNYNYNYSINKNDWNWWTTMTTNNYTPTTLGTALSWITGIDASKWFKLRIKITTITTNTTAITSFYVTTVSTATAQDYQYPLDQITLTLTWLQDGSDVVILQSGTTNILENVDSNSWTTYNYVYSTLQNVDIGILKAWFVPLYVRWYTLGSTNSSIPIAQVADRNYS